MPQRSVRPFCATAPIAAITLVAPLIAPAPVQAQAWQCHAPRSVEVPQTVPLDGPARTMPITGYTLALIWSPEYCHTHQGDAGGAVQCDGHLGRFGFILHGLWPDGAGGTWPQWCRAAVPVSPQTAARTLCSTPSPGLIAHEWAKHGTCMSANPQAYFGESTARFRALHFPEMARLSRKEGLVVGDLKRALAALNPTLPPNAIRVQASAGGWLQEVHVCLDPARKPRACTAHGLPDAAPLKIWHSFDPADKPVRTEPAPR